VRRLNLDIFEPKERELPTDEPADRDRHDETHFQNSDADSPLPSRSTARDAEAPVATGPRFIPVGFFTQHLRLLDDAVINLRRQGYWKASKSAIIRALIEDNKSRLQDVWLSSHAEDPRKND